MKNYEGKERRIGIELEFHGLTPEKAAEIAAEILNGSVKKKTQDYVEIDTDQGVYKVETDDRFLKKLSEASEDLKKQKDKSNKIDYEGILRDILSTYSDEFVPTELVTPPLSFSKLKDVTKIHKKLSEAGAEGSIESIRFAFGAQLNPELTSLEAESLLRHLRAYILSTTWLKNQIQMDNTRVITFFASDFPKKYIKKIFQKNYEPNIEELIDDYLEFNSTRNRGLDMLQAFAFIDEKRVRNAVSNFQKLKPRPTFHYRLPNCQLSMDSWTIEIEWKRWQLVEKLADNKEIFQRMRKTYLKYLDESYIFNERDWLRESNNYLEQLRL